VRGITRRDELPEVRRSLQLMKTAFQRLMRPARGSRTELVVAHGNLIRLFVCLALELKPATWLKMRIHHASITRLLVGAEYGEVLASFNEVSHLPPALRTIA
jgi:serine/threonine-protein phosphatase PGAM5